MERQEATTAHNTATDAPPCLSEEAGWPQALTATHRQYLHDRGVSPAVAHGRGYRTVTSRGGTGDNNLSKYGWGKTHDARNQINSKTGDAALIIPLFDATRTVPSTYQCRLDRPRLDNKGKPIKFESPYGVERGLDHGDLPADVHPLMASKATDTDAPLILTEGIPKADALLTAALAEGIDVVPVALTGVTMGYEAHDSVNGSLKKTYELTPSLARIVEGRETVYLCWDSDWGDNKMVRGSLARTGQLLRKAGVDNVIFLGVPTVGDTEKTGVDDWLAGGGSLAELLTNHQMPEPDLEPVEPAEPFAGLKPVYEVDEETRQMWAWEMRRPGSDPKARPVPEVKFEGLGRIIGEVRSMRIVDHVLSDSHDLLVVRLEWLEVGENDIRVPRTADIEMPAKEYASLAWLGKSGATAPLTRCRGIEADSYLINTIKARTDQFRAAGEPPVKRDQVATTGWYFEPSDDGDHRAGWRYLHGHGWIGSPNEVVIGEFERHRELPGIADLEAVVSDSMKVDTDSEARFAHPIVEGDLDDQTAEWKQWFDDWVLGGVVDRLVAEDPKRFKPRNKQEREDLQDLKVRLALGAIIIARSLLPGAPALGVPYLVGAPGTGKTLLAKVICSAFGERFGRRPYLSLISTPTGVEVKLADARNMVVLVDDFRPAAPADTARMSKVVDNISRSAHDGAEKFRAKPNLTVAAAPQFAGLVIITGEELPTQGSNSNSTVQRMITLPIRKVTTKVYEVMSHLAAGDTRPQQAATGFMIGALSRMLDEAVDPDDTDPASAAAASAVQVRRHLAEYQDLLMDATTSRTRHLATKQPTDRTKIIIKDLLLGGSLLIEIGHQLGVVVEPEDYEKVVAALTAASRWALTETAHIVADTTPANNVVDAIKDLLTYSQGHLRTRQDGCPADDSAMTWGWSKRADGPWQKGGDHIGFVLLLDDEPVVALNPRLTAKALRGLGGGAPQGVESLRATLAQATDADGKPVLVRGAGDNDSRRKLKVDGKPQHFLLVRPDVLGVDTTSLAPEATPKVVTIDEATVAFQNLHDLDTEDDDLDGVLDGVEIN